MTLVNALYSLAVGLLFGALIYALALLFPTTRPMMAFCWKVSPVGTILSGVVVGLVAAVLFILLGWWALAVWFLFTVCGHLVGELKRRNPPLQSCSGD